jgi:hypothetical protein
MQVIVQPRYALERRAHDFGRTLLATNDSRRRLECGFAHARVAPLFPQNLIEHLLVLFHRDLVRYIPATRFSHRTLAHLRR